MKNDMEINVHGTKRWYKDDKIHRVDGPAIEYANGEKWWLQNGLFHRLDGPALERGPIQKWYKDDKLHRDDGPAVIWNKDEVEWYFYGIKAVSEKQFYDASWRAYVLMKGL